MPLRSVKMNRFIFGFHRRVWCPKWTPLSSSWRMVTTVPLLVTGLFLPRCAQIRRRLPRLLRPAAAGRNNRGRRRRICARRGRKRPVTSNGTVVTMRQLLESVVHLGHQTRRWNPKMKRFIFTERNGIYIIDLQQTLTYIDRTYEFVKETGAPGGTVLFVDTKKEHIAVGEARKLGIPVVAILDTNCDPDEVDYKIPGNDDAIRSAALLTRVIADAVADGLIARAGAAANAGAADGADKPEPTGQLGDDEPLPEWERALYPGATAAAPVAADPAARTADPDPDPVPDAPSPDSALGG